jgi:hypothetical protein
VLDAFLRKPAVEVTGLALLGADAFQQSAASGRFLRRRATRLLDDAPLLVQQAVGDKGVPPLPIRLADGAKVAGHAVVQVEEVLPLP